MIFAIYGFNPELEAVLVMLFLVWFYDIKKIVYLWLECGTAPQPMRVPGETRVFTGRAPGAHPTTDVHLPHCTWSPSVVVQGPPLADTFGESCACRRHKPER